MKLAIVRGPEPGLDLKATIWNAFVGLVSMTEGSELSPAQRPAQLVFWYESEAQNGGHLQYLLNRGPAEAQEALVALRALGATAHAEILSAVLDRWRAIARTRPTSVDEYVEEALEGEFTSYDEQFAVAVPLVEVLQQHLDQHQELFVTVG